MKRKTVRAQQRRSGRLNAAAKKHRTVLFFESLLLQFVISSTRPDRHVGALIGILERLGYILRLISGNHLLIDRIVLIGFASMPDSASTSCTFLLKCVMSVLLGT